MNEQEVKAANLGFNFDTVEEVVGLNITQPGTIGMFLIKDGEYVESTEKKTPGLKLSFERTDGDDASEFNHTFWLTGPALPRIQSLALQVTGQKLAGQNTVAQLIAMFKGKSLPLKVTASINDKEGKVYPNVPYAGFTAATVAELSFNQKETNEIERSKTIVEKSNVGNADSEAPVNTPGTQSSADEF